MTKEQEAEIRAFIKEHGDFGWFEASDVIFLLVEIDRLRAERDEYFACCDECGRETYLIRHPADSEDGYCRDCIVQHCDEVHTVEMRAEIDRLRAALVQVESHLAAIAESPCPMDHRDIEQLGLARDVIDEALEEK